MATHYPKLVNKQFNSPIKLYSQQNVQEVLERETQILSNGAIGIDFHQLAKPANLKNSAVLRMLEEEEQRQRDGHARAKQVIWPPPPDSDELSTVRAESPVYAQGGAQYPSTQQQQQQPHAVIVASAAHPPPQPQSQPWAPVLPPVQQPVFIPTEPPPATITLRPSAPISQAPAPVFTSQPATASLKAGGTNMRGDQKWPPANVKAQVEAENEQRVLLARGPACRPRRVRKDYTAFFAQNALNATYPGYKAPPGTQHYTEEQSGVTNF